MKTLSQFQQNKRTNFLFRFHRSCETFRKNYQYNDSFENSENGGGLLQVQMNTLALVQEVEQNVLILKQKQRRLYLISKRI